MHPTFRFLTFFSLALTLLSQTALGQTGWSWLNPKPQGNSLEEVQQINGQTIVSVGLAGTILRTNNGGTDWTVQRSRTNLALHSVSFVHVDTGFVVGDSGIILKTSNSGQAWFKKNSTTNQSLNSVFFINSKTGWAAGGNGIILKTTNGGETWSFQNSLLNNTLTSIFFASSTTGWIVGSGGTILKTTNGGTNWIAQTSNVTKRLEDIHFANPNIGFAIGDSGTSLKTTDGGSNWNPVVTGALTDLYSVQLLSADTAYVLGGNPTQGTIIIKTTDGGVNWTGPSNQPEFDVYGLSMLNSTVGIAVGINGYLLKTTDGFENAENLKSGFTEDMQDLFFLSPDTGFVIGYGNGFQNSLKTVNGGISWTPVNYNATIIQPLDIDFISPNIGFICGTTGKLFKSVDRGDHWNNITVPGIIDPIRALSFVNADTGTVVGKFQIIRRTVDGGLNWTTQTGSGNGNLFDVQFFTGNLGFTAGENGIQHTTNGGTNWNLQYSDTTINSFHFFNSQSGFAVGNNGTLIKTSDAGANWIIQPLGTTINLNKIHFSNTQNGIIVGDSGVVFSTVNSGTSWSRQISYNNALLKAVYVVNDTMAYIAGSQGAVLKTTTSGSTCPDALFNYTGVFLPGKFCEDDTLTQSLYFDGTPGGTFSANPPGINIDPITGIIKPWLSTPGSYTVQYQVTPPNGCPTQTFQTTALVQEKLFIPKARLEVKRPEYALPPQTVYVPCKGDTLLAQARNQFANLGFAWYRNNNLLHDTAQEIKVSQSGLYAVKYRDQACAGTFYDTVQIDFSPASQPIKPNLQLTDPPLSCNDDFTITSPLSATIGFQWVDEFGNAIAGQTANSLNIARAGTYRIQIDSMGCKNISEPITILPVGADTVLPNLYTVTTKGTAVPNEKNEVQWNRITYDTTEIKRVIVYRASEDDPYYQAIAEIPATDSAYLDPSAIPGTEAYTYKISAKQLCGTELIFSTSSGLQNSIHLDLANHPPNNFILRWSEPEGFLVRRYRLLRGTNYNSLSVIVDSLAGSTTSYIDNPPAGGPYFYRVEAETDQLYQPWGRINAAIRKSSSNTGNTTLSFCDSCLTTVENIWPEKNIPVILYPNPSKNAFTLKGMKKDQVYQIQILDLMGREVSLQETFGSSILFVHHRLKAGIYLLRIQTVNQNQILRMVVE